MIRADQLRWTWADGTVALGGVDLHLLPGERVLLTGPSGCGKSTLARLIGGLLQHHGLGEVAGSLTVAGDDPSSWTGRERARGVGLVFQDPGDQLVAGTVADEVAFGPRSSGVPFDVADALESVGLDVHGSRSPHALSGGQQQRLAVAAGLAAGARVAVLDEPLAHLDPEAAEALLVQLDGLAASGTTVLVIEHRVEACLDWADRVVVLREGRVAYQGNAPPAEMLRGHGLQVPALLQVEAVGGLEALGPVSPVVHAPGPAVAQLDSAAVIRGGRCVLQPLQLELHEGERLAVLGPNGAGKSTLLHALASLSGAVWVPQDPDLSLFCSTVADELAYGPREWNRPAVAQAEHFGLADLLDCSPHALSRGQRLRVAVASAVSIGPRILLLDEPTAGQHADAVEATMQAAVAAVTQGERGRGVVVFATHDLGLALRWATRVIVLSAGEIMADGAPHEVVGHLPLPPLQRAQAARGWPLASLSQQLESSGAGPVQSREWMRVTARSEFEAPRHRRDGSAYGPLLAVATVGTLAVLLDRPASLGVLALVCVVALMSRPLEARTRLRLGLAMAAVVWSTLLSQGLFYGDLPRTAWVTLGPVTLWREGIGWGLVQSLRLIAVSSVGLAVALTLGPDRLLGALRGLRVPPGLAFLSVTALRFVPVVAGEWWVVRRARARRGRPLWRRGPLGWIVAEITMLRPLVVRALRRARRLAESLDSRGFDATQMRESPPSWTVGDRMIAVCSGLGLVAVISAQATYGLYLAEIYHHPSLRPLYAWVRAWL